ncbi:MAG: GPI inositol-deacylase [Wenzhouxiangella sp.]|nr:GPI inositol-deacylase [Wenzhouxiangella sp.]TVR94217.1 MAG: alpha/beta hydrolase [Wenzhouxiangellaceae bacterium]
MTRALNAADLYGLSRLAVHAVRETTDLVEQMHRTIARVSAPIGQSSSGRTRGITGLVYRSIHGVTGLVGGSLDLAGRHLLRAPEEESSSASRERIVAVINGVVGDHLEATANPLAIAMRLRYRGQALSLDRTELERSIARPQSRLLIAVHGLCLNHHCWTPQGDEAAVDLPAELARRLGYTELHLHYNTGRSIARNGRDLASLLEQLVSEWPAPVEEIVLLGHSMGGLVSRSACHYGSEAGHAWSDHLRRVVCLGSPHLGAPLEQAGHRLERLLGVSPYSAPFQKLGRMRSAGIIDLRHGRVLDHGENLQARLPAQATLHTVAATRSESSRRISARLIGDGLVPVASALGQHPDAQKRLPIAPEHACVLAGVGHMGLLRDWRVVETLEGWVGGVAFDRVETPARGR